MSCPQVFLIPRKRSKFLGQANASERNMNSFDLCKHFGHCATKPPGSAVFFQSEDRTCFACRSSNGILVEWFQSVHAQNSRPDASGVKPRCRIKGSREHPTRGNDR